MTNSKTEGLSQSKRDPRMQPWKGDWLVRHGVEVRIAMVKYRRAHFARFLAVGEQAMGRNYLSIEDFLRHALKSKTIEGGGR